MQDRSAFLNPLTLVMGSGQVFGRRKAGYMDIRTLNGAKVNKGSVSIKRLKYVSASTVLVERKKAIPLMDESMSFLA